MAADLAAALIVQWATHSVADEIGFRPAVILAGVDEQSTRHLGRLTTACERYEVPLVRMFSRLTEESSRHLDSRHTAFMRLATRPEALRAAEHIGLERKFVAGRFSHRQSVNRSRTKTTTESTTHTTGRAEGEATTHTTGTTTGQMYSEAQVPRDDNHVHIHTGGNGGGGGGGNAESDSREAFRARVAREREAAAAESGRGGKGQAGRARRRPAGPGHGRRERRRASKSGGGWVTTGGSGGKPVIDTVKTRTRFNAEHTSDAKTQSVTNTEETSHTRSESRSVTDGTSVGDEISFELVYDHTRPARDADGAARGPDARPARGSRPPPPPPPCRARATPQNPTPFETRQRDQPPARRRPRAGWSPSSSTRRSSAPTRWPRSHRTKSRPTSPPPPRSPRTSRPTSVTALGPADPGRPQVAPDPASPAHHSFFHTPRRLSSRDRNSSATQMAPVISPPRPSTTTMSTNEASQPESMRGPPQP